MRTPRTVWTAIAALCCVTPLSRAAVFNEANFFISPSPVGDNHTAQGHAHVQGAYTDGDFGGQGAVDVNYGYIKVLAESTGSYDADAKGTMRDTFTVTSASNPFGQYTMNYTVSLDGAMAALGGFSSSFWSLQVNINNGINLTRARKLWAADANLPPEGQDFGTYTGSFTWGYGSPVSLEIVLFAHTDAQFSASGAGHALVDLYHTLEWQGATITTTGGQPVPDAVITSDSGTNWLNAVPEPGCAALLSAPLLLLARRRARGQEVKD